MKNLPNYDPNNIMSWFQYNEKFLVKPEKKKKNSDNVD
jgi:hypothetical protein